MQTILHYILLISGVLFILVGIAGLFLPIIPGIIFIVAGLVVLGKKEVVNGWMKKLPQPLNKIIKF